MFFSPARWWLLFLTRRLPNLFTDHQYIINQKNGGTRRRGFCPKRYEAILCQVPLSVYMDPEKAPLPIVW